MAALGDRVDEAHHLVVVTDLDEAADGVQLGLYAFTAAVLGGIGNLQGAVLGGFLIGILTSLNDGMLLGQQWSMTVVFTVLILLMVFKPEGILGSRTTEKV